MLNPLSLLPDFRSFKYAIAVAPSPSKLDDVWAKFQEAERRLATYRFVKAHTDPGTADYRILLDDAVSAFLLTFEATIQFLREQLRQSKPTLKFAAWFAAQSGGDICVDGVRALRHFHAHIEPRPTARTVNITFGARNGQITSCIWKLPEFTSGQLCKLHQPPALPYSSLPAWNSMVTSVDAEEVFEKALLKLRDVITYAESLP